MRIVVISQRHRHSDFAFGNVFAAAGHTPRFHTIRPPEFSKTLNLPEEKEPVGFVILEALQNSSFTEKMLTQVRNDLPDTPVLVFYHGEATPKLPEARAILENRFLGLGANAFIDTTVDALTFGGTLLETAGITPEYRLKIPERAVVPVGDFHFDLLARKAYYMRGGETDTPDTDEDGFRPIAHAAQRILFNARSGNGERLFGPEKRAESQAFYTHRPSFDLSKEEAALIHALRDQHYEYLTPNLVTISMHDEDYLFILPRIRRVSELRESVTEKLRGFVGKEAEKYILCDAESGFALNEPDLTIPAGKTKVEYDAEREERETALQKEFYPHWEKDLIPHTENADYEGYKTYNVIGRKFIFDAFMYIDTGRRIAALPSQHTGKALLDNAECLLLDYLDENADAATTLDDLHKNIFPDAAKIPVDVTVTLINRLNAKLRETFDLRADLLDIGANGIITPKPEYDL